MLVPRLSEEGPDTGKWYMVSVEGKQPARRAGYCALQCVGHETREEAVAHHLQYQLDRQVDLRLERRSMPAACEICGQITTLRARLGVGTKLFVLCASHQSTISLRDALRAREPPPPVQQG
jgi:hypothetical protein